MIRRRFIKQSLSAAAFAASYSALGRYDNLFASPASTFDLVAVKGGEPAAMFDKGIEALGGMKAFVKKGQKVVIKPNIGWDVSPERAGNTNPQLVARIVQHCLDAGAKEVYVFDHTCDKWTRCYSTSGIERAVTDAGGKIAPGDAESYYQVVKVPAGKQLTEAKVHELILESDVFINVPVLKSHGGSRLTMAMKNHMGIVWDRKYWHRTDLHQCIADFASYRKPDLNILDAYAVMKENGPRGVSVDDVVTMKAQLISTDQVALDAAGAKLFGMDPKDIPYISFAAENKVGRMNLDALNIKRISL
ncbi:MAG: DUF362 domain-containing protein [Ignavibacteriae bacterium]|nr:DUF362 domain-containing protein [Ignavibacteriota bacterium]